MLRRLFALAMTLLLLGAHAPAQLPGQGQGRVELEVRVLLPNEQPASALLRVQLLSGSSIPLEEKFTNSNGEVSFSAVSAGVYRLRVNGPGIEQTVSDTFFIQRDEFTHMEFIHVQPRADATQPLSTAPSVFAGDLNAPKDAKKEFQKGNEELSRNNSRKAIEHFGKAVTLHPQYASAFQNMGVAWLMLGDMAQARQAFENAVRVNDHMVPAYISLSRISLKEKKPEAAQGFLTKALAGDPMNLQALTLLAAADLMRGNFAGTVECARKVHSVAHPSYPVVHYFAARALEAQQRPADAIAEYTLFLKEAPDSPEAKQARDSMERLQKQAPAAQTP